MKFLAENNLGKLGRWLRALGFDTALTKESTPEELLKQAEQEKRLLLTRNRKIISKKALIVQAEQLDEQLKEVAKKLKLKFEESRYLTRCLVCNGVLKEKAKEELAGKVPPKSYEYYDRFWQCQSCGKAYWKGTHWDKLIIKLKKITNL